MSLSGHGYAAAGAWGGSDPAPSHAAGPGDASDVVYGFDSALQRGGHRAGHSQGSCDQRSRWANIFQIIENPNALTRYAPGITEVADIHQSAGHVGDNFKATYSLIGLKFPTKYTTVEYTNPSKLVVQLDGQMVGTFGWTLVPKATRPR